jgi:hypothetical protein
VANPDLVSDPSGRDTIPQPLLSQLLSQRVSQRLNTFLSKPPLG